MTPINLINVYLEGFRACHYEQFPVEECPYRATSPEYIYWHKGYHYAKNLEQVLFSTVQQQYDNT